MARNQPSTDNKANIPITNNYFRTMKKTEKKDELQYMKFKIQLATAKKIEAEADLAELKLRLFKQGNYIE